MLGRTKRKADDSITPPQVEVMRVDNITQPQVEVVEVRVDELEKTGGEGEDEGPLEESSSVSDEENNVQDSIESNNIANMSESIMYEAFQARKQIVTDSGKETVTQLLQKIPSYSDFELVFHSLFPVFIVY